MYLSVCPAPYLFYMNKGIKHITSSIIFTFHRHFTKNEQIGVIILSATILAMDVTCGCIMGVYGF